MPQSRAGESIELRAEMDLVCGLTARTAEDSNNRSFKPIDFVISAAASGAAETPAPRHD